MHAPGFRTGIPPSIWTLNPDPCANPNPNSNSNPNPNSGRCGIEEMAGFAAEINKRNQDIGARRLNTVMHR